MTLTIVSCRIPPIYRGNRAGLQRRSGESRLVSFLSPGTGQWVSWAPPSGEKRPFLRVCCEPDPVIKGTHSSKEAAQPTEPSACPADWVLLGKIIAYSPSGVEDRKKLCPLHTYSSWSREYVQKEMTTVTPHSVTQSSGETLCSHKVLKSLSQSRGCLCYGSFVPVFVVQSDQGWY